MTDAAASTMATSHKSRLGFERLSGYGLAVVVFSYASIGLWSDKLAARVVELAPSLSGLATVLGTVMGASWFRGHMDERIQIP